MNPRIQNSIAEELRSFDLPGYNDIPNIGLFLDQTNKYIAEYLAPLDSVVLTSSMISNYVKKGILRNPVRKQYDREQIAYLFFIALAKTVLSLEDIQLLLTIQRKTCDCAHAYEFFRAELKQVLNQIFHLTEEEETVPTTDSVSEEEIMLLRNTIVAMAHKVYLDKYFCALREEQV